ncbi:unconventional myosin-IXa-like isoform X2 [Neocloeon triangulifer]|uniref:unconventional myosin-IXa-like isoform X2 n=1 Tax=Neocloeon triangulifer TaxID=2078957 RepID=UPI00286F6497|nr:unconventional myosin-IXa-like isoform X2 [Neocloeon triangulifer]
MDGTRFIVQVFVGALSQHYEALSVEASKQTTCYEIVACITERLSLGLDEYELAEVVGQECKERRLGADECPVALMLLWPKQGTNTEHRFYLRKKASESHWTDSFTMDPQLIRDYFYQFLYQPKDRDYPDLCQLPDLNEQNLLENLRARFSNGYIYTYVGSILIAVNPFKFYPIYNPKYVKLYQNRRLVDMPPHIFAIADAAYHCMLRDKCNQCIVISGESGSGKTESTNFLLHHLTALSQKGSQGSGVEQTILSAGPVLEAFGNAKTAHNNNSSRFGKFIQVNYKENGMVHGAVVQKYLLEKSRICSQGRNERNYHVFYYLLSGSSDSEKKSLHLKNVEDYNYLNRSKVRELENVDERYEFSRLKQSLEMVGFSAEKQRRLFAVLSAVLLLGNIEFSPRKSTYHHDEAVGVKNEEVVSLISELLRVKEETLLGALTAKRAKASGETLIINYRLPEAIAARDAMAKCLYGALFDWIVMQVNHALFSKKDTLRAHHGCSIGVLDIFGFEDFGNCNSYEQFCINYANEHLQFYFNQHVFKYEQEEYSREGIKWKSIDFKDNAGCLTMIEGKPSGLLCILDDQCNFPGASDETLLQKYNTVHKENKFYEVPHRREAAFIVQHYAGKVKYQVREFREKNLDLMRPDIVSVLKNSSLAFVRELVGADPVAVFRWAIVRAYFRAFFAFNEAGKKHRSLRDGGKNNFGLQYTHSKPNNSAKQISPKVIVNKKDIDRQSNITKIRITSEIEPMLLRKESFDQVFHPSEAIVLEKANQIVMKNKSGKPRDRRKKSLKNLESVKSLACKTHQLYGNGQMKTRKQPQTVSAQFQQSLHSLMVTLNQANPFFIRCIKSNANKVSNEFDTDTVQRQLRYTGMLETVRIRQAGYNVRFSYDEFIQLYRILLPKGLLSSQNDVKHIMLKLNLSRDNFQMGKTKVFLRESEKLKLDSKLHQQIIFCIVTIQRWFRAHYESKRFKKLKQGVITLQSYCRGYLARQKVQLLRLQHSAAIDIQRFWRGYRAKCRYKRLIQGLIIVQAHARGNLVRKKTQQMLSHHRKEARRLANKSYVTVNLSDDWRYRHPSSSSSVFSSEHDLSKKPSTPLYSPGLEVTRSGSVEPQGSRPTFQQRAKKQFQALIGTKKLDKGRSSDSEEEARFEGDDQYLRKSKPVFARQLSSDSYGNEMDSADRSSSETQAEAREESFVKSDIEWHGSIFKIAGHTFRKTIKLSKDDCCAFCGIGIDAFHTQGYKCSECKQIFHTKCIQNGGVQQKQCRHTSGGGKPGRRKNRKRSSTSSSKQSQNASNFNLTGVNEFMDSADRIISGARELKMLQEFITEKIFALEKGLKKGDKRSEVDRVFRQTLLEFKENLVSTYSIASKQNTVSIKYKDLIANFLKVMETVCQKEKTSSDFPVTMGVNAFRGFLNEFMAQNKLDEKPKEKRKKEKKRDDLVSHGGHLFQLNIINIPTACEVCSLFFMWPIERGLVCQNCKLTCHRKCYSRAKEHCGRVDPAHFSAGKVFGVPLYRLITGNGDCKIPIVVDRLINIIEMYGIYTEGIYRKSGVSSKVRELKSNIEQDLDKVNLESYQVHVLAAVLKSFFREMPEPLLTYENYDDFIRAASVTDPVERVKTIFLIVKELPRPNYDLTERLIFHLARVAQHEDVNRMNASSLAIVFAPCILRTNKMVQAQDSLNDISKQTLCVETIIGEQLRKVRATLADITTLDSACHTATSRLSSLRSSKIFPPEPVPAVSTPIASGHEEALLAERIQAMKEEKAILTNKLPTLTHATSDDDFLSTDFDGSLDDVASVSSHGLGRKKLRQRSSDQSVVSMCPPLDVDIDEDPILV